MLADKAALSAPEDSGDEGSVDTGSGAGTTLTEPEGEGGEELVPAGSAERESGMKALPSAGFGGGEGRAGEGAGAVFSAGFAGIGSGVMGSGATGGSEGEGGGAGEAIGVGAGVESGTGAGVESDAGAGVVAVGVGDDRGALGVSGVNRESGRAVAGGVAEFDASAGFAGFRGGGGVGSFGFGSSGFSELAGDPCRKGGKLGPEDAAPVGGLSRTGEGGGVPLPELAETGAIADAATGAGLLFTSGGVD